MKITQEYKLRKLHIAKVTNCENYTKIHIKKITQKYALRKLHIMKITHSENYTSFKLRIMDYTQIFSRHRLNLP